MTDETSSRLQTAAMELRAAIAAPSDENTARVLQLLGVIKSLEAPSNASLVVECALLISQYLGNTISYSIAIPVAQYAVDLAESSGLSLLERRKAVTYVGIFLADIQPSDALRALKRAWDLAVAAGDNVGMTVVMTNTAYIFASLHDQAMLLRCSLSAMKLPSTNHIAAVARSNAANALSAMGRHAEALRFLDEAVWGEDYDPLPEVNANVVRIRALAALGRRDEANKAMGRIQQLVEAGAPGRLGFALKEARATILAMEGRLDEAIAKLRELKVEAVQSRGYWRDAVQLLTELYRQTGRADLAKQELRELMSARFRGPEPQASLVRDVESLLSKAPTEDVDPLAIYESYAINAELAEDPSGEHIYRVGTLSAMLATRLGWTGERVHVLRRAARLHDLGKIGVSYATYRKRGDELDEAAWGLIRAHADMGADLLEAEGRVELRLAATIARQHHEWVNGSGYPLGLAGDAIAEEAQIVSIADTFDVMTHDRPWRAAKTVAQALEDMNALAGKRFNEAMMRVFSSLIVDLQETVGNLDAFLGKDAAGSPYIQARRDMAEAMLSTQSAAH